MNDDTKLRIIGWLCGTLMGIAAIAGMTATSIYSDAQIGAAIQRGVDPLEAKCAFSNQYEICSQAVSKSRR